MKILSVDVGIKNLAFCCLDTNIDKTFTITQWKNINLADEEFICCGKKNTKCGSSCPCTNKAFYTKNGFHYCKVHAKKCLFVIPTDNFNITKLRKLPVYDLFKICRDNNIEYTKSTKKGTLLVTLATYIDTKVLNILKYEKAKNIDLIKLGIVMKEKFDKELDIVDIDMVIIENQISPLAGRMKTLQGMITQYFIMREITNIEFVSASNKLKFFSEKKKTTYTERKKRSIQLTTQLLQDSSYLEQFKGCKKKDDLADSFLQGLWYLNQMKLISI